MRGSLPALPRLGIRSKPPARSSTCKTLGFLTSTKLKTTLCRRPRSDRTGTPSAWASFISSTRHTCSRPFGPSSSHGLTKSRSARLRSWEAHTRALCLSRFLQRTCLQTSVALANAQEGARWRTRAPGTIQSTRKLRRRRPKHRSLLLQRLLSLRLLLPRLHPLHR